MRAHKTPDPTSALPRAHVSNRAISTASRRVGVSRNEPLQVQTILQLQRLAGNAAIVAVQRQPRADAETGATTGVQPGRFSNSGTSQLGRTLGFHSSGPYFVNGIEIVFPLDPGARARYTGLRPRQWSGPEAVFSKTGQPLGSPWQIMSRGNGSGPDDPQPESQRVDDHSVLYDDSPGPSVLGHVGHTWIHAVQNFTGWVEGRPRSGGAVQRLTEVIAWYSVISVVNPDAGSDAGAGAGQYQPMGFTRSGTGWVPTDPPSL
jgi:hypothetical protein